MNDSKKMYNMLQFYNEKRQIQDENDKITSIVRMDTFKIDKNVDIDLGEIYFVTREKQYEESNDSYMYYEIYTTENQDKPIAKTNEKFEIEILDEDLNQKLKENNIDLEKDKKIIREMLREDDSGNLISTCAVMDKYEHSREDDQKRDFKSKVEKIKKGTVYNDKSAEALEDEDKQVLNEDEIKEKSEEEGKKIQDISRIDDPMFYQLVPDATVNTYFVTYDDGTVGVINSHGDDITQLDESGISKGSLSIRKMERDIIQTDSKDAVNREDVLYIDGSTQAHGIVFPIVNVQDEYLLEMKDIYDDDQQSMPVSMQGSGNEKDNRKFLDIDEKIVKILKDNGIDEPNDKDVKSIARYFFDKGDNQPDEISVLKEYKRINMDVELNDYNEGREERKPKGI